MHGGACVLGAGLVHLKWEMLLRRDGGVSLPCYKRGFCKHNGGEGSFMWPVVCLYQADVCAGEKARICN